MINKPQNWNEIEETEVVNNSNKLVPGIYPVRILKVTDISEKEYLQIEFDIIDGNFKDYFKKLEELFGNWSNIGIYRASYKDTAAKFFKSFITAIQKSNPGYVWDWNEQSLIGKVFIAVLGEVENYYNGELKIQLQLREARSIEAWKKGDIKLPPLKKYNKPIPTEDNLSTENILLNSEDLPF